MAIKVSKVRTSSTHHTSRLPAADTEAVLSAAWPLEYWLQFQSDLFRATAPGLLSWIDRRCEGAGAVLHSIERLAHCQDAGDAIAIQSDWLNSAMERLDRDIQAIAEQTLAVSQCTSGATQQAAQAATGMATHGAKWVVRRAETATHLSNSSEAASASTPVTEVLWQSR